jgi:hypothetical protein
MDIIMSQWELCLLEGESAGWNPLQINVKRGMGGGILQDLITNNRLCDKTKIYIDRPFRLRTYRCTIIKMQ